MTYANLASSTKMHRASQIIADIGSNGLMQFYTGSYPASPDIAPAGTLLASLALSSPAAAASYAVQSGVVTAGGTGGADGVYALSVTGGGGTGATGTYTVSGGSLATITITGNGFGYTSAPTLGGFGSAGLTGATATPVMTATLVFNAISTATAVATGTAGFVRIAAADGTGIIDLDVGATNAFSVIISNTFISSGGSVSCSAEVLLEA